MPQCTLLLTFCIFVMLTASQARAQSIAHDPGPRGGPAGAGGILPGLSTGQIDVFNSGRTDFEESETIGTGLGPRFNLDSCGGCHSQPATGGSSSAVNPQVSVATAFGARNVVPSFIRPDGPVREARFKYKADGTRDGGVHALFVVSGRHDDTGDATGCTIGQDDFDGNLTRNNVVFRIPTPVFGGGLIELIPDRAIVANQRAAPAVKALLGITGRPNRNGNDGTITRFGWKAQNKSLLLFAGEAYNVEQGVTNELFQNERDESASCPLVTMPNDVSNLEAAGAAEVLSSIQKFALFMTFLAPPQPSTDTPGGTASIGRGRQLFSAIGCALCHTPMLTTGPSATGALDRQMANLFSDLLLHNMGAGLADDVLQGGAGPDEFRTAPLWGLGQRLFFMHDGRTRDLVEAIRAHRSAATLRYPASEANLVVDRFRGLGEAQKQDVLNFLRSL